MSDSADGSNTSLIALLDLHRNSRIGLDGQTIVLQADDFVGIDNVPPNVFHLVTTSNSNNDDNNNNKNTSGVGSLTVAFVIFGEDPVFLARRYDPQTEEVSAVNYVDESTVQNLIQQIESRSIAPNRVLNYNTILNESYQQQEWMDQTYYINRSDILDQRGISSGNKIVPGSYDPQDNDDCTILSSSSSPVTPSYNYTQPVDGKSIQYPPIPVIDTNLSLTTHKHDGTKRFLSKMIPSDRTRLFMMAQQQQNDEDDGNTLGQILLDNILEQYYHTSWEALLGDLQLSYCLFLYIQCFASLVHWKDLVSMLALSTTSSRSSSTSSSSSSSTTSSNTMYKHLDLYRGLLQILPHQLSRMDDGFLEDVDEAGGNFLLPSLRRLYQNLVLGGVVERNISSTFQQILGVKFPQTLFVESDHVTTTTIQHLVDGIDHYDTNRGHRMEVTNGTTRTDNDYDTDVDDGPVVVPADEIEASLARSSGVSSRTRIGNITADEVPSDVRREYPILVAAIMPNEDIVMTCARALDEKNDVSLVREAAAYLENVEKYR